MSHELARRVRVCARARILRQFGIRDESRVDKENPRFALS